MAKLDWSAIGTNMVSSIGNGLIGGLIGLGNTALQHKYNKELSDYQFDQNISMWNMQNEYNSPTAQRERLEAAGLNPALLYGNGGGSTGNATQMPQYQSFGQSIGANMLQGAQIANLAAQARLTNAEAEQKEQQNPYAAQTAKAILDNYLEDLNVKKTNVRHMEKGIAKMDVEMNKMNNEINLILEQINLAIAEAKTEADKQKLLQAQEGVEILKQGLVQQEIKTETERTETQKAITEYQKQAKETSKAQEAAARADAALSGQKKKTEEENTKKANADALYREWEADYVRKTGRRPDANFKQFILTLLARGAKPREGGLATPDGKIKKHNDLEGAIKDGNGKYYDPDFDLMD